MIDIDSSKIDIFHDKIFVFRDYYPNSKHAIWMMDNMDSLISENDVFGHSKPWKASNDDHLYGEIRDTDKRNLPNNTNPLVRELWEELTDYLTSAAKYYFDKNQLEYEDRFYTEYSIFRYNTGQEMGPHVDNDDVTGLNPFCTGIIYLNDNKKGGDLYFKEQDVLVTPSSGTMVIFPCVKPFYHQSTLITEGVKYHVQAGWKETIQ